MLGPTLFHTSINDLVDQIESILSKFANDTKLGGELNTSEGRVILQRDMGRLEQQVSNNCMKFTKDNCKVLHLG